MGRLKIFKHPRSLFLLALCLFVGFLSLTGTLHVFAQSNDTLTGQSEAFRQSAGFEMPQDPRKIVALLANIALVFLGTLMMGYTILGGYLIMTAAGNEDRVSRGRRAIWTSVVGLVIVLTSYGITRYVLLLSDYAANEDNGVEYQPGNGFEVDFDVEPDVNPPNDPLAEPIGSQDAFEDLDLIR